MRDLWKEEGVGKDLKAAGGGVEGVGRELKPADDVVVGEGGRCMQRLPSFAALPLSFSLTEQRQGHVEESSSALPSWKIGFLLLLPHRCCYCCNAALPAPWLCCTLVLLNKNTITAIDPTTTQVRQVQNSLKGEEPR